MNFCIKNRVKQPTRPELSVPVHYLYRSPGSSVRLPSRLLLADGGASVHVCSLALFTDGRGSSRDPYHNPPGN